MNIDRVYNGNDVRISGVASLSFTLSCMTLQIIHPNSERLIAMEGDDCITASAKAFENITTLSFNSIMPKNLFSRIQIHSTRLQDSQSKCSQPNFAECELKPMAPSARPNTRNIPLRLRQLRNTKGLRKLRLALYRSQ